MLSSEAAVRPCSIRSRNIWRRALVGRECDVADGREAWSLNIIARLAIVVRRLRKR